MAQIWITPSSYSPYVAATGNLTLSGLQTIDSVSVADGQIVLATAQTDATTSGPYVCHAGTWDRIVPLVSGQQWAIQAGSTGAGKIYQLSTANPIIVGTTSLTIAAGSVPAGSVGTTQLANGSVTIAKLGNIADGNSLTQSGTFPAGSIAIATHGIFPAKLGTITDGVTLDQGGPGGQLRIMPHTAQTLSAAGTADAVSYTTIVTSSGVGIAIALANGNYAGQRKTVCASNAGYTGGNTAIITAANSYDWTSVTLTVQRSGAEFEWTQVGMLQGSWALVGLYGSTLPTVA